jgi:phospholipase/carboxylesterase
MKKQSAKTITKFSRREMLRLLGFGAFFSVCVSGCDLKLFKTEVEEIMAGNDSQMKNLKISQGGRLSARVTKITRKENPPTGLQSLKHDKNREAQLYIPKGYNGEKEMPFALMLHGAGGNAQGGINFLKNYADESGIIIFAPKSIQGTWDMIINDYGADVEFIDRSLKDIFERCNIDKSRLAVGGFSDGASYALSLGIINGDLFSHVLAFSPGFMAVTGQMGAPSFFISHGTQDRILPIDRCSRKLVPQLKTAGYKVIYKEFEGPHTIPVEIAREAVEWFTKK